MTPMAGSRLSDPITGSIAGTSIPVGKNPYEIALDAATHTVYVLGADSTVSVIDAQSKAVIATVQLDEDTRQDLPNHVVPEHVGEDVLTSMAVDPTTHDVYVARASHAVRPILVIDHPSYRVGGADCRSQHQPMWLVNAAANTLYSANYPANTVSAIDLVTGTVTASWEVGDPTTQPTNLVLDPSHPHALCRMPGTRRRQQLCGGDPPRALAGYVAT